jgi:hypothetical protein
MEEDELPKRHMVGIDTVSVLEGDGAITNTEEMKIGEIMYLDIMKLIPTDRQKFIAIALDNGFTKVDISYMLGLSCSVITREAQKMQLVLTGYYKRRYSK